MRIISLVPSLTELLFAFGLGESIVGVTRFCVSPAEARKPPRIDVGGPKTPKIPRIKALKPDIIIMSKDENTYETYLDLKDTAEIMITHVRTVKEVPELMRSLAYRFGVHETSSVQKIIHKTEQTLSRIERIVSRVPYNERPRVFTPIWRKPWMTINKDTYVSDLIEFAGGINVFRDLANPYPQLSIEQIANAHVDIMFLPSEPYCFKKEDYDELVLHLKAPVKHEFIDGSYLTWYGMRTAIGLELIHNHLYHSKSVGH